MKKKLENINIDLVITIYIVTLLIYIFLSNIAILYEKYTVFSLSTVLIVFCSVGILIYLINRIINKVKFDMYDLIIFLLIFFAIISTIYSINVNVSLFGFHNRHEGLFQLVTYYILFLNCKNINNKKYKTVLTWIIFILGSVQALYGILQFFDAKSIFGVEIIRNRFYSTGFQTNPNFLGTVMITALSLSLTMYFMKKNIFVTVITLITSSVLFLGLLCSGAMSGIISFIFLIILLIILLLFLKLEIRESILKILIIVPVFFVTYKIFDMYDNNYLLSQFKNNSYEISQTLKGEAKPIYGSGRINIWTNTLSLVPENLWNGVGIDNLFYAFEDGPLIDIKSNLAVDKAHNEYLQKLVTEGIFSFIFYLCLLFIIFFKSINKVIRNRNKVNCLLNSLLLGFIAYSIQAFFNISVISVAPLFYIIIGLLVSELKMKEVVYEENRIKRVAKNRT